MLMTGEITERALQLLDALRTDRGVWMTRAELARATGKSRLSPHDVMLLERLIEARLIEKRQRESNTPVGIAYDYRAKE